MHFCPVVLDASIASLVNGLLTQVRKGQRRKMEKDGEFTNQIHTKVCDLSDAIKPAAKIEDAYRALINHHIQLQARPRACLANDIGIDRRRLGRILSGEKPFRLEELIALIAVLGIDPPRAMIAIGLLDDWQRYSDVNLGVVLQLLQPVLDKLEAQSEFSIEPLTEPAVARFSDWLAEAIIANEEQIRLRRDSFHDLPEVRRPARRLP